MAQLASSFEEYGQWRDTLAHAIAQLRQWLVEGDMLDADAARRVDVALDRLAEDKLVIAFVAEFSRGKSELINAIFFADYGKRILPSSAGRTTMCPTELLYDESLPPCIRALPIETRSRHRLHFRLQAAQRGVAGLSTRYELGRRNAERLQDRRRDDPGAG